MLADMRHLMICTNKWHPTASPHSVFPTKSARVKLQLYKTHPQNFSGYSIGGCFGCNTDRVMALGWLKKEEESTLLLLQAGSISCSIYL